MSGPGNSTPQCANGSFLLIKKQALVCLFVGYNGLNTELESQYVACMVRFLAGSCTAIMSYFAACRSAESKTMVSLLLCALYCAILNSIVLMTCLASPSLVVPL